MTTNARNAVARRAENVGAVQQNGQQPPNLAQQIERMRPEIARALPKHMDADRIARIALTTLRRTPKLGQCSPESFLGALMTCSQLGVEPGGPTGEAYLVPYKGEVTFVLGYKGMAKLFWQSPMARSLSAQVVYENDHFEYEFGLDQKLVHRPSLSGRGKPIAYYAVATTVSGGSAFVVLSTEDVEKHRKHSAFPNGGPWKDHYEAMAKKTCVRELFKLLPVSVELAQANAQDNTVRTEVAPEAIDAPGNYIAGELESGPATTTGANGNGQQRPPQDDELAPHEWDIHTLAATLGMSEKDLEERCYGVTGGSLTEASEAQHQALFKELANEMVARDNARQ